MMLEYGVIRNCRTGEESKIFISESEKVRMKEEIEKMKVYERSRPFTETEVANMLIKAQINILPADDQTALRMISFYPSWDELCNKSITAEKVGYKFTYNEQLYKTLQPNYLFVAHYVPGAGTESLFARIDEAHDGSKYDPIPYGGNMALDEGKYYIENEIVYKCIRSTGNAVYNPLSELVGLYVEVVIGKGE